MANASEFARKVDRDSGVESARDGGFSPVRAETHPLLTLQQQAGNQAVQSLLRSGLIQAKLSISQPDDPEEREADQVADRIMRSHAAPLSSPCSCSSGEEMCEECQQKRSAVVSRKASNVLQRQSTNPQPNPQPNPQTNPQTNQPTNAQTNPASQSSQTWDPTAISAGLQQIEAPYCFGESGGWTGMGGVFQSARQGLFSSLCAPPCAGRPLPLRVLFHTDGSQVPRPGVKAGDVVSSVSASVKFTPTSDGRDRTVLQGQGDATYVSPGHPLQTPFSPLLNSYTPVGPGQLTVSLINSDRAGLGMGIYSDQIPVQDCPLPAARSTVGYLEVPDSDNAPLQYQVVGPNTPLPGRGVLVPAEHDDKGYFYMYNGRRVDLPDDPVPHYSQTPTQNPGNRPVPESSSIQRQTAASASPQTESTDQASTALSLLKQDAGLPLDPQSRAFFEPRFGRDFSDVRVHTGQQAAESAHSIQAHAYTAGNHIVFGASQHQPSTPEGKRLLAHELAHVAQRTDGIRRQSDVGDSHPLDPKETWSWQAIQSQREIGLGQKDYQEALNAVPGASLDLTKELKDNPSPSDADRDRVIQQIRQLIRMNAIGLMRDNHAYVEFKRDELLGKPQSPDQAGEPLGLYGAGAGAGASAEMQDAAVSDPGTIKNAEAVRAAAKTASFLAQKRKKLEDSARAFDLEAGSQGRVGGDSFMDALRFMYNESWDDQSDEINSYLHRLHESLKGKKTIERGMATSIIFGGCRYLEEWRWKQANGVTAALDQIYQQFPFFAQLSPSDVPEQGRASSAEVMGRVRDAYDLLLWKIDGAIVEIGGNGIDPFDLPEAVKVTRDNLSPAQQQILDQAMQDRQARQFWLDMGLTLAQVLVVFIPVVGPALAVGMGAGQVIAGVHDALSRYQISEAAINPEQGALGITGPSRFEWAMLGVQAALTAADLGSLWSEMNASRLHFHEDEPKLVERESKTEPPDRERETTGERGAAEKGGAPGKPELEREAEILEQKLHDPENVQDVLDPDLAEDYDYQIIIEAEEKHTYYHRRDGKSWCRASGPALCGYSFGKEVEEALNKIKQARRPSASGKPTEQFVEDFLGSRFRKQRPVFEGKRVKGAAKYGMSIADFSGYQGSRRIVVEVKNIDVAANMRTGFLDLRGQVGGYLSNVPHPDTTKFWLFLDIRGQKLPPGGLKAIVESVSSGTGYVFDNVHFITEVGVVVY
jgi:hypothetical protein